MRTLLLALALLATPAAAATVSIDQGTLSGTAQNGIAVYKNIPYAAPPVGALRWRDPQPAPHWQGTRDAAAFGPACAQSVTEEGMKRANLPQSEDCLSLNLWTPGGAKRPVMVWIHGGGFTEGSAALPRFDGAQLATHGMVVVTFNYRLGRFGFFAHPSLTEGPNFGLEDQVAALAWVKANIAAFGGDPSNVTIFGESAGGDSVTLLMAIPSAKGLFAKAISESGSVLFGATTLENARKAAAAITLPADPRSATTAQVLAAQGDIAAPIVDGKFLPQDVPQAFAHGHIAHVPLIIGNNSGEGLMLSSADNTDWLVKGLDPSVRKLYGADLSELDVRRQLFNDRFFRGSTHYLAGYAGAPTYVYDFGFLADVFKRRGETAVRHGGEIAFVFGFGPIGAFAPAQDTAMVDEMQTYWTNFAKTGDPNGAGVPLWPRYEGAHPQTLVIGDETKAVADFRKPQLDAVSPARTPAP
ncbi:MAG TPA: carboxylesterase family protein [Rhizomicrobium sp.]|jgi:para-nitrobenzyl esterase|nr:carboxylesterase family protein [Rhizomicrobium sp.]